MCSTVRIRSHASGVTQLVLQSQKADPSLEVSLNDLGAYFVILHAIH